MQQERDSETHRARLAESRFAALKEKAGESGRFEPGYHVILSIR